MIISIIQEKTRQVYVILKAIFSIFQANFLKMIAQLPVIWYYIDKYLSNRMYDRKARTNRDTRKRRDDVHA